MLAAKIVWDLLDELSQFGGCDIQQIVNDEKLYEELVDDLIDRADKVLHDTFTQLLED